METALPSASRPLGAFEKTRVFAAIAVAALILHTMGWMVAQPVDPALPVTFVRGGRAVLAIWPALAALAVVSGIIGTVVAGPRLPEAGVFAASIGMAVLGVRSGSMQTVLAVEGAVDPAGRRQLARAMAVETLLWAAIMVAVWLAVVWAYRWVWTSRSGAEQAPAQAGPRPKVTSGWPALAATTVVGAFIIWLTVARSPVATIEYKQTVASVIGGLYLGALAARYFTGLRDVRWYVLAAPAIGLLAWLVAHMSADLTWMQNSPLRWYVALATTPAHNLARPMPLVYIAGGVAGALAGYWAGEKMEHLAAQEAQGE